MVRWLALGVTIACSATACKSYWTAETIQKALVLEADKAARTSEPLTIVRRDMELRRVRLRNTAYYVVLSRDRFRFHLTLLHKFEEMSDVRTWDAWVEDERGVHHVLEDIDQQVTQIEVPISRYQRRAVYRGVADFTIYARNLFDAGHRVTLVLRRPGFEYRYVWQSADPDHPDA